MNDSRLRVYEQLEVSMVELERTNKRLGEEGLGDKERIRDLGDTVRSLEIKCEELQRLLDEVILRARPGHTGEERLRPDITCQVSAVGCTKDNNKCGSDCQAKICKVEKP